VTRCLNLHRRGRDKMDTNHRCESEYCGFCDRRLCCNFLMDILAPRSTVLFSCCRRIRYILSETRLELTGMLLRPRVYSAGWRVFDPFIQFTGFLTRPELHLSSVSNSPRVGAQIHSWLGFVDPASCHHRDLIIVVPKRARRGNIRAVMLHIPVCTENPL